MINPNLTSNDSQRSSFEALPNRPNQLNGREVAQIKQDVSSPIAKAYDKAISDYQELQRRLEGQIQQKEIALFDIAYQKKQLQNEFLELKRREEGLRAELTKVTEALAEAKQVNFRYGMLVKALQEQVEHLKGEWEKAIGERDELQRRLEASLDQNKAQIEDNIALQREINAIRQLPVLEQALKEVDAKISNHNLRIGSRVILHGAAIPLALPYAVTYIASPILGLTGAFFLGTSSMFAYIAGRSRKEASEVFSRTGEQAIADSLMNEKNDVCYKIIEIRKGITKDDFLSKSAHERNQIFSELGLGHHILAPSPDLSSKCSNLDNCL